MSAIKEARTITRLMIILWKWKDLLNEKKAHDEFDVYHAPEDKIIRINVDVNDTVKGEKLILNLAKEYIGSDIFIFLHRNHNYNEEHVGSILKKARSMNDKNTVKCFLFSDGRDFIYYNTKKEGLLNQGSGEFVDGHEYTIKTKDDNGKMKYETIYPSIVEKETETGEILGVKHRHFDRVWNHYLHEFESKINSLTIDLFSELSDISKSQKNRSVKLAEIKAKLNKDEFLKYRLRSFLGYYDNSTNEFNNELDKLKKHEKKQENSFVFDDCNIHFGQHSNKNVVQLYKNIKNTLKPIFEDSEEVTIDLIGLKTDLSKLSKSMS